MDSEHNFGFSMVVEERRRREMIVMVLGMRRKSQRDGAFNVYEKNIN